MEEQKSVEQNIQELLSPLNAIYDKKNAEQIGYDKEKAQQLRINSEQLNQQILQIREKLSKCIR